MATARSIDPAEPCGRARDASPSSGSATVRWDQERVVAVAAVMALTAVNDAGVQKSARLTRGIVGVVLAVLGAVAIAVLTSSGADGARVCIGSDADAGGVYALVAGAALAVLGPDGPADAAAPLTDAVRASGADWLVPVVRVGAAVAALGSLLALILGVSRTTPAMARDRRLPHALAAVLGLRKVGRSRSSR